MTTGNEFAFWDNTIKYALMMVLKIVVFVIGYLIIKLGHSLLREGVRGEFKFTGQLTGLKANLTSASPGLLFLLLGVILIGYGMGVKKDFATYYESSSISSQEPVPEVPLPNKVQ